MFVLLGRFGEGQTMHRPGHGLDDISRQCERDGRCPPDHDRRTHFLPFRSAMKDVFK
jgi:hypothetical protein